jgi:hypothetical protein
VKRYVGRPLKRGFALTLLSIFGDVVVQTYKLAFGGFDELFYRRSRKKFVNEIKREFSDIFSRRHGKVIPNEGINLPRAFDYVAVTIEFKEIRFRIIRGRGELRLQAAEPSSLESWQDLSLLWHRKPMRECGDPPSCYAPLGEVAQRIDDCWDQLLAALEAWQ